MYSFSACSTLLILRKSAARLFSDSATCVHTQPHEHPALATYASVHLYMAVAAFITLSGHVFEDDIPVIIQLLHTFTVDITCRGMVPGHLTDNTVGVMFWTHELIAAKAVSQTLLFSSVGHSVSQHCSQKGS